MRCFVLLFAKAKKPPRAQLNDQERGDPLPLQDAAVDADAEGANADGSTTSEVVAPRLRTTDLRGRALIVHAGGDTYSDVPPLGGGGARIACGIAG